MTTVLKFTPKRLRRIRKQADSNFFFFSRALWGNRDLTTDLHLELCNILQSEDWRRLLVCGFRGCLKSSIVHSWAVWYGLTHVDWSCMLIEQREANAQVHHEKIQDKFRWGPHSGLLQELYRERLPPNFEGWRLGTNARTIFVRDRADADPFMVHAGLDSRLESAHKDCVMIDDPEGADADRSDAPNYEAQKLVTERVVPLLRKPMESRVVLLGTPHGANPTVHYIRRLAEDPRQADSPIRWHMWWQGILEDDDHGDPVWPERFPMEFVDALRAQAEISAKAQRLLDMQYFLKERSAGSTAFNFDKVQDAFYEMVHRRMLRYQTRLFQPPTKANDFTIISKREVAQIDVGFCNRYLHVDPLHKDPEERRGTSNDRPSEWAIIATAVAPDLHAFVIEEWVKDAPFEEAVEQFFRMYRYWQPIKWTLDPIGAQSWLRNHLRVLERTKFQRLTSMPTSWSPTPKRLARPSSRLVPSERANTNKEVAILEHLELPLHSGWLHLSPQVSPRLLRQIEVFGASDEAIDALDALAQGPEVWEPPMSQAQRKRIRYRAMLQKLVEQASIYVSPFRDAA